MPSREPSSRFGFLRLHLCLSASALILAALVVLFFIVSGGGDDSTSTDGTGQPGRQLPAAPSRRADPADAPRPAGDAMETAAAAPSPREPKLDAALLRDVLRRSALGGRSPIDVLQDPDASMDERRAAAFALASRCDPDAREFLVALVEEAAAEIRAAVGEALGSCTDPDSRALQMRLLEDPDPAVARGAIRGLGERGDEEAVSVLSSVLSDASAESTLREEAALALGEVRDPKAADLLIAALHASTGDQPAEYILEGLGSRPLSQTREFFREYVSSPDTPAELKAAAIEALGNSEDDVTSFVLDFARHPDPEVRKAAAFAMTQTESSGDSSGELYKLLAEEPEPGVRLQLFAALEQQPGFDAEQVRGLVAQESRTDVRLAGLSSIASACAREGSDSEIATYFDQEAAVELEHIAVNDSKRQNRMWAVIALRKARTPSARQALERIASVSDDPTTAEAAQMGLDAGGE